MSDFMKRIYDESLKSKDVRSACAARGTKKAISPMFLDSGSDIHLIRTEDANKLFKNKRQTNLRVMGVSGVPSAARMEGDCTLNVADEDGHLFEIDLGTSYASDFVPLK